MSAFARFVLRDNGLAVFLNPQHIAQVRETADGDPAVFLAGRDTPLMVEGTVEETLGKLDAAANGLAPQPRAEAPHAPPAAPRPPAPAVKAKVTRKADAKSKSTKVVPANVDTAVELEIPAVAAEPAPSGPNIEAFEPVIAPLASETEIAYPGAAWFMGQR